MPTLCDLDTHSVKAATAPGASGDFLVFVMLSAICAALVALRPLNFLSDDSLFYLVIADHIAAGDGSTFNGLFPTNGYHPLWQACAALLAVIPHTKGQLLACGVAFQWLLLVLAVWVLLGALRPFFGRAGRGALLGSLLVLFVPVGNLYWSEAPLTLLFLALLLSTMLSPALPRYGRLGVLLGLLFLSRLDNVFMIASIVVALWYRDGDRRLAIACAICAAIAGAYMTFNVAVFGHIVPISGAIKSALSQQIYFSGDLGPNGVLSLTGALGLALVNIRRRSRSRHYRIAMLALSAGVLLQSLYVVVLTYGDTWWPWYYVAGYLCVAVLAAEAAEWLPTLGRFPTGTVAQGLAIAVSLIVAALKFAVNSSLHDPMAASGDWREAWIATINRALPADRSVLVVFDQPGLFAYGTSHPVLSLDGLTSNYTVNATMGRRGMYAQLLEYSGAYLIAPLVPPGGTLRAAETTQTGIATGQIVHFATPLGGADAGCVTIDSAALVTRLQAPPILGSGYWGVWRLTGETMRPLRCPFGDMPARTAEYFIRSR